MEELINSYFQPMPRNYRIDPQEIEEKLNYNSHKEHLPFNVIENPEDIEILSSYIAKIYKITDPDIAEFYAREKLGKMGFITIEPIEKLIKRLEKQKIND